MDTVVVQELERLLQETRIFLAYPDPDLAAWEAYGERRASLFTCLSQRDFPGDGEEGIVVTSLLHQLLELDAVLMDRARAQLDSLRTEIEILTASRRALESYAPFYSALLVEHRV